MPELTVRHAGRGGVAPDQGRDVVQARLWLVEALDEALLGASLRWLPQLFYQQSKDDGTAWSRGRQTQPEECADGTRGNGLWRRELAQTGTRLRLSILLLPRCLCERVCGDFVAERSWLFMGGKDSRVVHCSASASADSTQYTLLVL